MIVFVFRHVIWKCLNFDSSETKNGDHLCSNFQKLSMAMHRLHLCLNFYQIKRSRNQRNLREIGEWKFFFRFVDYEVFTCIPRSSRHFEISWHRQYALLPLLWNNPTDHFDKWLHRLFKYQLISFIQKLSCIFQIWCIVSI